MVRRLLESDVREIRIYSRRDGYHSHNTERPGVDGVLDLLTLPAFRELIGAR